MLMVSADLLWMAALSGFRVKRFSIGYQVLTKFFLNFLGDIFMIFLKVLLK